MKKNPGRKERRKLAKAVHHNAICKKYSSKSNLNRAMQLAGCSGRDFKAKGF